VFVTVVPVNDLPVANPDTATVAEDGSVVIPVLANDTDVDGQALRVFSYAPGAHGTVTLNPDNTLTYTPAPNFNGTDSFPYKAADTQEGQSAFATVTITVTPANDAPVAVADSATVIEDGTVSVAVLSNDTDPDGDTLIVASVTQGAHGAVSINPDKTVKYTPAANYNGSDSFTYTISDGNGGTATANVAVTITGVNDAPVANADTATVAEDANVSVAVLANDTDSDGDTLTVTSVTQGAHGAVSINPDKTVKYTPAANYSGSDSFTYTISDGNGGTATATVTVTVTAVNDAPVANADTATVAEDGMVSVTVLSNDTDPDGDTLTVASVTQGAHGTVSINPDKTVKYTPAANYNGSDSFTYTISDGNGGTATATVTVTVTAFNDAPIANADTATLAEDSIVSVTVLANDTDADGDTLTVTSVTQGAHAEVSINPDKTVKYKPAGNYNGPDAFTYTISDGHGGTATAAVTVSVTAVNDPPVAVNDTAATVAGSAVTITVLANDSDIDSPSLTVTAVTQGTQGTVAINPDKTVTFTAGLFVGTDSFTYTISDGNGGTSTATVTVTVAAAPRVATGIQARYNFNEGSGSTVADTSGVGTPLNLTINNTSNVSWVSGGLTVNTATRIENNSSATKIINAVKASNAVTVEAWLTPTSLSLTGPSRILDLSKNSAQRNLVFGQSGNRYESQIKTSSGTNSLQSPAASLTLNLMHVVYTHNSGGQDVYYINGVQVSSQTVSGNLSSWGTDHKLTLSENWRGTYFLVGIYGRALSAAEVQQNYLAGVNAN
jgi:VCBS repeat-containing protein